MPEAEVTALLRDTFWLAAKLGGPPLLAAMVAGLLMSFLQAILQITEPTLSFVPKAAAVGASLIFGGAFMWSGLSTFTHTLFDRIVAAGGW